MAETVLFSSVQGDIPLSGTIVNGVLSGAVLVSATISASQIEGGTETISGATIQGGTISGAAISAGTVTGATINGGVISGATIENSVPVTRNIPLVGALSDAGVPLTATATGGAMGVSRTAGTSAVLVGETASAATKTDKALLAMVMPTTYAGGSSVAFEANANTTGSGTITSSSTTLSVSAYLVTNGGSEIGLAVTGGAQEIPNSATNLSWTISGANTSNTLQPGGILEIELTQTVVTTSGAATGQVNGAQFTA
jgi:hypothetical protein